MRVCKVLGPVVASAKHPAFVGRKTLIVQPVTSHGDSAGDSFIAVDNVQAGAGDWVLVLQEGNGIRQVLEDGTSPVRALIVGIVDAMTEEHASAAAVA
jgi:ethanolamine utilization protein EutN